MKLQLSKFKNKTEAIMYHMKYIGPIGQDEAADLYGSRRLASLISSKKKQGYSFETIDVKGKDRFGKTFGCVKYKLLK